MANVRDRRLAQLWAKDPTINYHLYVTVEDDTVSEFVEALPGNDGISFLSLLASDYGCEYIFNALSAIKTISRVRLSRNMLTPETCAKITAILKTNTTIREMSLNGNNVGDDAGIADVLKNNIRLWKLDLCHCNLSSVVNLAESLQFNSHLVALHLSDNNIGVEGGIALGRMLQTNITLNTLVLNRTHITSGAIGIANALMINSTLQTLSLHGCGLDIATGLAFATALEHNRGLHELILSGNNFLGTAVDIAFGKTLHMNNTLTVLALKYSGMADVVEIGAALATNRGLRELSVDSINERLIDGLQKNPTLRVLECKTLNQMVEKIMFRNCKNAFWTPMQHVHCLPQCHTIVMCTLMAANHFRVQLPIELWLYHIFTFFRPSDF